MFEASPSPTPSHETSSTTDSASFPATISDHSVDGVTVDYGFSDEDLADILRGQDFHSGNNNTYEGEPKKMPNVGRIQENVGVMGGGEMSMEIPHTDDTPMALDNIPGKNASGFFLETERKPTIGMQPLVSVTNGSSTPHNGIHPPHNNNSLFTHVRQSPQPHHHQSYAHNNSLRDPTKFSIGIGEPGPSNYAHPRPGSRGTSVSSSVSPIMSRHDNFRPMSSLQAEINRPFVPTPSSHGTRSVHSVNEDVELDQKGTKRPKKATKPRSSVASASSVGGDIGGIGLNFAGMGLMNSNVHSGMGMGYGHPMLAYSNQTSLMPTPNGSNEEDETETKHWTVVSPLPMTLNNLPLIIHGIKRKGAKSRVETQIKMRISIVRPTNFGTGLPAGYPYQHINLKGDQSGERPPGIENQSPFERVATYKAVKIKAGMGARKRVKKGAEKDDPNSLGSFRPEEVLFLYTEVWCTDHPARAFACARCVNRERRRAQARAPASKKKTQSESDEQMSGTQSSIPNHLQMECKPEPVDAEGLTQDDKERILLFNCGPIVALEDGECDLPARLTCYCRHHKEKTGFRIVFSLRDHTGRIISSGTTPPVMITDDHKTPVPKTTTSITSGVTDGAISTASRPTPSIRARPKVKKVRENSASTDEDKKSTASKRPRQSKPYDRKAVSEAKSTASHAGPTSPRGSFTPLGLSMTPLTGRSLPGSPMPVNGAHSSYFMSNGLAEPGSGAISPSLVMSGGGPYEGQLQGQGQWTQQGSPMGLTAALPAISQQLSQWAATSGQAQQQPRKNQERGSEISANGEAMQLDDQHWKVNTLHGQSNLSDFAQSSQIDGMQFQLRQPDFGDFSQVNHLDVQSGLGVNGFVQPETAMDPEPDFESMLNFSPQSSPSPLPQEYASPLSDLHDTSTSSGWSPAAPLEPPSSRFSQHHLPAVSVNPRPCINRLVPAEGPTHGGIEVTILGENFHPGMVCLFGNFPAVTVQSYGPTTLVCLLPASPSPGPVQVQVIGEDGQPIPLQPGQQPAIFTYNDTTDRKLMEMALTAVGLRVTGQVVGAVEIARRIMGGPQAGNTQYQANGFGANGHGNGGVNGSQASDGISVEEQKLADELASAIYSSTSKDIQGAVIKFLSAFLPTESRARIISRRQHPGQTALNHVSAEGQTLLHLASLLGFADLVHLLIRADATVDIHDRNGYTAFVFAAMAGHVTVARLLLAAGAREASCTFSNQTAATLAIRAGHHSAYAAIHSRSRRMHEQAAPPGHRRSSMASESSVDADNPSSATGNDSVDEDIWAISPNRLTTAADILAVRRPPTPRSPQLLPRSKYDVRTETDAGNTTPRASAAPLPQLDQAATAAPHGDEPPPYMAVDGTNWLQRTLSHLPQSRGMPPAPHIKDFIPPALWEKLPSAQVFIPQMPQMPTAEHQWGAQAWLAMPMSAFMNVLSAPRIGAEQAVPESSSTTAVSAQPQKQQSAVDEIGKKQAVEVAQAVAKVQAPAVTTATPRRREARSRRTKEPSSTRRHELSSSTAIKRSPLAMQEPPPAKVDKMLFLFWLPVLAIAFVYTLVTTLPFTLGRALLGPILGPLTKLLKL